MNYEQAKKDAEQAMKRKQQTMLVLKKKDTEEHTVVAAGAYAHWPMNHRDPYEIVARVGTKYTENKLFSFKEYLVEERSNYVRQNRKRIENIVKKLAPQFNDFESFKMAALAEIDNFNPKLYDLQWGYDQYKKADNKVPTVPIS